MGFHVVTKITTIPPVYGTEKLEDGLTVYEIINDFETGYRDHVYQEFKVTGTTLEECFKNAYPSERSLRYCSGRHIQFKDREINDQYNAWKKNGLTMEMYYGSGTID